MTNVVKRLYCSDSDLLQSPLYYAHNIQLQLSGFTLEMGKCVFNKKWLADPRYKSWVHEFKGDRHAANCCVCSGLGSVYR
jgi:hypothetical protein